MKSSSAVKQIFKAPFRFFTYFNMIFLFLLFLLGGVEAYFYSVLLSLFTIVPLLPVLFLFNRMRFVIEGKTLVREVGYTATLRLDILSLEKVEYEKNRILRVFYSEKDFVRIEVKDPEALVEALRHINPKLGL